MVRRSRAVVIAVVVFFAFGTGMCCLTIVLLLFPRTPLDAMWRINPEAKEMFGSMGGWAIVLMVVVGAVCAASAIGLARRAEWGRRLAMTVLFVNLVGDAIGAVLRHDPRTLVGVPIGAAMIALLARRQIRLQMTRDHPAGDRGSP